MVPGENGPLATSKTPAYRDWARKSRSMAMAIA